MKKKKKSHISTIILIIVFFVGLSVMLYPTISDFINSRHQQNAILNYDKHMSSMEPDKKELMLAQAQEYNSKLASLYSPLESPDSVPGYKQTLDVTGTGIMAYIHIPKLDTSLPIYHGTSEEVLNVAVGHVQGSSFPVGGANTHSVISAHRGLPSAKLFSDLDQLEIGDTFEITVLDRVLRYSVDRINVIEPDDFSKLRIEKGRDLVTLVTCTPYGINTHRLLVRGTRLDINEGYTIRVEADAFRIEPMLVAPIIALPMIIILLIVFTTGGFSKKRRRRRELMNIMKNKYKFDKRHRIDRGGDDIE